MAAQDALGIRLRSLTDGRKPAPYANGYSCVGADRCRDILFRGAVPKHNEMEAIAVGCMGVPIGSKDYNELVKMRKDAYNRYERPMAAVRRRKHTADVGWNRNHPTLESEASKIPIYYFGRNIKILRERICVDYSTLAYLSGMTEEKWKDIEASDVIPTSCQARAMLRSLRIPEGSPTYKQMIKLVDRDADLARRDRNGIRMRKLADAEALADSSRWY